jgi:hypothetical protein
VQLALLLNEGEAEGREPPLRPHDGAATLSASSLVPATAAGGFVTDNVIIRKESH